MKRPVEDHGQRSLARPSSSPVRVVVLGRFALVDGRGASIPVANATRRLLSFLALRDRVVHRASVAGALWPDVSESHAHASLRSSLLRIPNRARSVITVTGSELCLSDGVDIDVRDAQALAHRLLDETLPWHEGDVSRATISQLAFDLLPGWIDEWVVPEAEGWRQLRLHALEALTDHLAVQHRFGDATAAAMTAIKAEPLRESAHAALIRVHLAESNQSEAFRQFERYQDLLRVALGIEPTTRLRELVGF
ncbi:MAG: family transcriptional regulator, regulator of embCAB operon [Actinomycetota bacterium]|jgi:DNA-binding SARP family transcriptional activator|nr:family transcriptional regulator, regulator of embCAB operon [Actinomycetota bacterium]